MGESHEATLALHELSGGDAAAADRLLPLVYEELRALAGSHFRRQRADHTLQPTALVHEAFVKLISQANPQWNSRAHFFAIAATAMRQILTDHARRRRADKRGGDWDKVSLEDASPTAPSQEIDIIALNDALDRLRELDPRRHRVVELRFFGGLPVEDVATLLGVSKTTAESDWRAARAWLAVELAESG